MSEKFWESYKPEEPRFTIDGGVCYALFKIAPEAARQEIRQEFNDMLKKPHPSYCGYHHKIPVYFGGDNSPDNLVLMPFTDHEMLHKYIIEPQVKGMRKDEVRQVMLPVMDREFFSFASDNFKQFLVKFKERGFYGKELNSYMKMIETRAYKDLFLIQNNDLNLQRQR